MGRSRILDMRGSWWEDLVYENSNNEFNIFVDCSKINLTKI